MLKCLIKGMPWNVTKCNGMYVLVLNLTVKKYTCRCLIKEMLRNAEAETTKRYGIIYSLTFWQHFVTFR